MAWKFYMYVITFVSTNQSLDIPTHALVHFEVDNSISAVPVSKFIEPRVEEIEEGCQCTVRWEGKRSYQGTVLLSGMCI